jgi:hypothetical protein
MATITMEADVYVCDNTQGMYFVDQSDSDMLLTTTTATQTIRMGTSSNEGCAVAVANPQIDLNRSTNLNCNVVAHGASNSMGPGTLYTTTLSNTGSMYVNNLAVSTLTTPGGLTTSAISAVTVGASNMTTSNLYGAGWSNVGADSFTSTLSNAGNLAAGGLVSASNLLLTNSVGAALIYPSESNGITVGGTLTVTSNLNVTGTLTVTNVAYIQSNLTVYSSETVTSNLYVFQDISADGSITAGSDFLGTGLSNVGAQVWTGALSNAGALATDTLAATSGATIGGTLFSTTLSNSGDANFVGVVAARGGLYGVAFSNLPTGVTYAGTLSNAGDLSTANLAATQTFGSGFSNLSDGRTFIGDAHTTTLSNTAGIDTARLAAATGVITDLSATTLSNVLSISAANVLATQTFGSGFSNLSDGRTFIGDAHTTTLSNTDGISTGSLAITGASTLATLTTDTLSNTGNLSTSNLVATQIFGTGFSNTGDGVTWAGTLSNSGGISTDAFVAQTASVTYLGTQTLSNTGDLQTSILVATQAFGTGFSNLSDGRTFIGDAHTSTLSNTGSVQTVGLQATDATVTNLLSSTTTSNTGDLSTSNLAATQLFGTGFSNLADGRTFIGDAHTSTLSNTGSVQTVVLQATDATVTNLFSSTTTSNTGDLSTSNLAATQLFGTGFSNLADGRTFIGDAHTTTLSNTAGIDTAQLAAATGVITDLSATTLSNVLSVSASNVLAQQTFGTGFSNLADGSTYIGNAHTTTLSNTGGISTGSLAITGASTLATLSTDTLSNTGDLSTSNLVATQLFGTGFSNLGDGRTFIGDAHTSTLSNTGSVQTVGLEATTATVTNLFSSTTTSNTGDLSTSNLAATQLFGTGFSNLSDGRTFIGDAHTSTLSNTGSVQTVGLQATDATVTNLFSSTTTSNTGDLSTSNLAATQLFGTGFSNLADGSTFIGYASTSTLSNSGALSTGTLASSNGGVINGTLQTVFLSNSADLSVSSNLFVAGDISFNGALLQGGSNFVGSQWVDYGGSNIYFVAGVTTMCNASVSNLSATSVTADAAGTFQSVVLSNFGSAVALTSSNGFLGVGLASGCNPQSMLHVGGSGGLTVDGNAVVQGTLSVTNRANVGGLHLKKQGTSNINNSNVVVTASVLGFSNDNLGVREYFSANGGMNSFRFNTAGPNAGEVMRLTEGGLLGLGTAAPTETLTVVGTMSLSNAVSPGKALISTSNNVMQYSAFNTASNTISHEWYSGGATSNPLMVLDFNGNLLMEGSMTATADVYAFSDARLKTALAPISGALASLRSLVGYTFLRTDLPTEGRSTGLLAQDVQAVLPEAVKQSTQEGGYLSVSYGSMAGLFVEAIKDLAARVEALEAAGPPSAPPPPAAAAAGAASRARSPKK